MPQRVWAILTIALGLTLAVLDGGIANVALPTIAREVHTSPANSIWVVNAYQLAVTVSLLPLSSLGEIHGYRRIYQAGLVLFTLASLACAMSSSLSTLIVARMLQGLGAAGIMSVNSALIRFIYPRRWLGRGVGLNATVGSIASALGPSVASVILAVAPWPWLFAVNVPLGVLGAVIALRTLPLTPLSGIRFDYASAALQAVAFGFLLFGVSEMGHGDSWVRVVALEMVIAAVAGFVLVVRQLSRTAPLLPVDLLRIPLFALSVTTSVCSFIAQAIAYVSMPFLFEHRFQLGQVMTGLLMTPWPLVVAVIAPFAGRLADRYSAGLLGGCGLAVMGLGLLAMGLLPDHPTTLGYRLADDGVRDRLRLLQHAEQPRDHHLGSAGAHGWGERHAGDREAAGPDDGGGAGGAGVHGVSPDRHDGRVVHRRRGGRGRHLRQLQPAGGALRAGRRMDRRCRALNRRPGSWVAMEGERP